MSRRSLQISQLGSSVHSDLELEETPRGRARGRSLPLDQLLALLPPNDTSFEDLSEASGELSVTSYTFEDDDSSCERRVVPGQFSSVHREVMAGLRPQTKAPSVCSTCSSCDTCSTDPWIALGIDEVKIARITPKPLPPQVERQIQDQIAQISIEERGPRERRERDDESGRRTGTGTTRSRNLDRENLERDRMSGLWNMLATYDEFVVTPPGFNAYQQEKPHWLDQEPIPWEQREKARRKCVRWLNSCQV